ncbi:MAG: histidine kinase dimerization/phospho-acceptor domain-containing protein [Arhodomonas sp.]|nr:histidine kinase dimerization/phospho-acceptor domain-containing protein [Arhodomonas sp.]
MATVSHDLRTPLTSMRGYLESLKIKGEELSNDERAEFLQIALDQGERLSRLVDELFELASLDAREREPRPEPFAPAELIHDVARKHQPAAAAKAIDIELDVPRVVPFAIGDARDDRARFR